MAQDYYLALGGNLPSPFGTPEQSVLAAVRLIEAALGRKAQCAPLYQTSPVPLTDQPDFVNTALRIEADLAPADLLAQMLEIEQHFGRERRDRWDARTLDIDILAAGQRILPSLDAWTALRSSGDPSAIHPEIMLPHPRLDHRLFVLAPLRDIAPDWIHPCLGQTVEALYQSCAQESDETVVRLGEI